MDYIVKLFLLFIIYSFIGWSLEVICKLIEKHRFINRGFLIGPICPIYGWGSILMVLLLQGYKENIIELFIMAIVICSILEYLTSYLMEKIFKTRWWDYSTKKFNLNGRICADTMIPFGLLGVLVVHFINPFLMGIINIIPLNIIYISASILLIGYIVDNVLSFNIIFKFKNTIKNFEKDATEEITNKVRTVFQEKSILYRRFASAFQDALTPKEYLFKMKKKRKNKK